jgi:hypothetical protein
LETFAESEGNTDMNGGKSKKIIEEILKREKNEL